MNIKTKTMKKGCGHCGGSGMITIYTDPPMTLPCSSCGGSGK